MQLKKEETQIPRWCHYFGPPCSNHCVICNDLQCQFWLGLPTLPIFHSRRDHGPCPRLHTTVSNVLRKVHECDRRTDGQTDRPRCNNICCL